MQDRNIELFGLFMAYLMLIIPLSIIYCCKLAIMKQTIVAVIRMTLQLLFVGVYLQVVFKLNNPLINVAWLVVMIIVADFSIVRSASLRVSKLGVAIFGALCVGTSIPLLVFAMLVLNKPALFDARFMIPIGGMILGNCLRADIIGIGSYYRLLSKNNKAYLLSLSQGASVAEASHPFLSEALTSALSPTIATMATVGLVSLPGMMTGVILGGSEPATAIKYQLVIMLAIFTGTAITVLLAIKMTQRIAFNDFGMLNNEIFASKTAK